MKLVPKTAKKEVKDIQGRILLFCHPCNPGYQTFVNSQSCHTIALGTAVLGVFRCCFVLSSLYQLMSGSHKFCPAKKENAREQNMKSACIGKYAVDWHSFYLVEVETCYLLGSPFSFFYFWVTSLSFPWKIFILLNFIFSKTKLTVCSSSGRLSYNLIMTIKSFEWLFRYRIFCRHNSN